VSRDDVCTNCGARLEKVCAQCRLFQSQHFSDLRGLVPLQIDQVEYLALSRRQLGEEMTDVPSYSLPVDATARLLDLSPAIDAVVDRVADLTEPDDIPAWSAPLLEAWAESHAIAERRLFRA